VVVLVAAVVVLVAAEEMVPVALETGDDGLSADAIAAQIELAPTAKMLTAIASRSLKLALSIPFLYHFPPNLDQNVRPNLDQNMIWMCDASSFLACPAGSPRALTQHSSLAVWSRLCSGSVRSGAYSHGNVHERDRSRKWQRLMPR